MNDRAVAILEQYDLSVPRTYKGRGAIILETDTGLKIIKEYTGTKERAEALCKVLSNIKESGFTGVESLVRNKNGELITKDRDENTYIIKEYFAGKECSIRGIEDLTAAGSFLAVLHKHMLMEGFAEEAVKGGSFSKGNLLWEIQKHNKELKKVRGFLRKKSQKSEFEIYLQKVYDEILEDGRQVEAEYQEAGCSDLYEREEAPFRVCHGDYQYHNILFTPSSIAVINFEKFIIDTQVRDLALFMRKVLEKNNWSKEVGYHILNAYMKEQPLNTLEMKQLKLRLSYPEKFWKIVNYYYNSGKAFVPDKNKEKLEKIVQQQFMRRECIRSLFS